MNRKEARDYLLEVVSKIGSVSAETLSDKDRTKMIEAVNVLYYEEG